ncbi:MAG TPA: hypothetical protein VND15_01100 [Candidatus Acidoferrales bacterium]|nr:hypothetical protein [Candidatus Acidoferrales bacterium]
MLNTKGVDSMNLKTKEEINRRAREMKGNEAKAEELIGRYFGDETLKVMRRLKDSVEPDRPAICIARQIAKPDIQHNSLFLAAKELGFQFINLEWTDDRFTAQNDYKKSYVAVPFASAGGKGTLNIQNIKLASVGEVEGSRLDGMVITRKNVAAMKEMVENRMSSGVTSCLQDKEYKLVELHSLLRQRIEGPGQLTFDASSVNELSARYVEENKIELPTAKTIESRLGKRLTSVAGPRIYLLNFLAYNYISNLVLAPEDFSKDDPKLQAIFYGTVSYLRSVGLAEPMQTLMPELDRSAEVIRQMAGSDSGCGKIHLAIPAIGEGALDIKGLGQNMETAQLAAAGAILRQLKNRAAKE